MAVPKLLDPAMYNYLLQKISCFHKICPRLLAMLLNGNYVEIILYVTIKFCSFIIKLAKCFR